MNFLSDLFNPDFIAAFPPAAIFFLLVFGTFVSEDLACIAGGVLAARGDVTLFLAVTACLTGIFVGDLLLFGTGRVFGRRVLKWSFFSRIASEAAIDKASQWLDSRAFEAIFLSRFVPGLRLPTYLAAGFLRTNARRFAIYFLLAALVWTPILVGISAYAATNFPMWAIALFVAILIAIRAALPYREWRNRRLFAGRIRRLTNWEFWPLYVFYAPVAIYVLLLGIKHRSLTIWSSANPAIVAGGFAGESKNEIYRALRGSAAAAPFLLKHRLLPGESDAETRVAAALEFMRVNSVSFPVVVKPDAGERGKDVAICRSEDDLRARLGESGADLLIQEFAAGEEVSIFYFRYPGESRGRIFSITDKRFPVIEGDGERSLETLILADRRAVALAAKYFDQNRARLGLVPERGEAVRLVEIGTHSRGAIFLDGERFLTDELATRIDEICRGVDGFYFGRFDIRCESHDELMRGRGFWLIELNGVTSESTNIYDPKFTLFGAYRVLFRQWRIACEIGAANRARGVRPVGIRDVVRLIRGGTIAPSTRLSRNPGS